MKTSVALIFLLLASTLGLQAQVILPETGRLAGPLNTAASEFGDEFFFFPDFLGTAAPGQTAQNGWIEIQFGIPNGSLASFSVSVASTGPDESIEFSGGQTFILANNQLFIDTAFGTLNLETGVVEDIVLGATFKNSGISRLGRYNRLFNRFNHVYPPDLTGFPLPPFPPGFNHASAAFIYDSEQRIVGFDFTGLTLVPAGLFGIAGLAPYSFGATGEAFFSNPTFCTDATPLENCPNDTVNRNGLVMPRPTPADPNTLPGTLHPHIFLRSEELREVSIEADVPACVPHARSGSVGATFGNELYQIGGSYRGRDRGRVDIHNLETNTWSEGERMAVPVVEAQGAAIDDKVYILGGRRFPRGPSNNILQIYDTESGEWELGTGSPWPIAQGAAAAYGGRLYIFAGLTNRPNGSPAGNLRFADYVQIYDPASDSWEVFGAEIEGAPIFASGATAVADGTVIYLINGRNMEGVTNSVRVFDALNNQFFPGTPSLWGTYDASAVRIGKRVYLSGGRSEVGGASEDRLQVFEIEQGSWIRGLQQPLATTASGYAAANGRLYVLGGRTIGGPGDALGPDVAATQYFDPARGWRICDSRPFFNADDIFSTAALAAGPKAYAPGTQMTIDGSNLSVASAVAPPGLSAPTELGGVSITVDGEDAPMLSVSPERVDFQIPFTVRTNRPTVEVVLTNGGVSSNPVEISVVDIAPHIFIQSCNELRDLEMIGDASSLSCHPDGSLNYPANPVVPGGSVRVQMTGLGAVDAELDLGERAPADTVINALELPTVMVEKTDGTFQEATVVSATLAPGELGVYDVEIVVPADTFISNRSFFEASAGGVTSNRAGIAVGTPVTNDPVGCLRDSNPFFRSCVPAPSSNTIFLNQF